MKNKGFTILEILVVLAVLAILIGIAVPRIKGMQNQGNVQKVKSELRTLQSAVESYYMNHSNTYMASSATPGTDFAAETIKIVSGEMLDPFKSTQEYNYVAAGNYYIVWSVGVGGAATITGVNASGVLQGTAGDDLCVSNSGDASITAVCNK